MPANLPPQYFEVERRLKDAKTIEEKLAIYRELLSIIPKHKGTEKLQAEIKTKISKLNKELQKKPATKKGIDYFIPREGAGQVVLVGPPNSGKSLLLNSITNARSEVSEFPYTTRRPVVGMAPFEDIQIQIIDLPSIGDEEVDAWVFGLIRNGDLILIVVDLGNEYFIEDTELVIEKLKEARIEIDPQAGNFKKSLGIANKIDLDMAQNRLDDLKGYFAGRFEILAVSALTGAGLVELKKLLFNMLDVIRVYTKAPGKPIEKRDPVILRKGSTVLDAAERIHKDFARNLKFVRLWGRSLQGQRVERNYQLEDGDVVEFHI